MRFLVVEDESVIAQDVAWVIENVLSFSVAGTAATSGEALTLIASEIVDAVVLDANLEDGTSEAVATELVRRHIPYFVLSGSIAQSVLPGPLDCSPMLAKPYREKDLISQLKRLADAALATGGA
jgi:CheY-like chemotaxis protein